MESVNMLTPTEATAVESQIVSQQLTPEQSESFFGTTCWEGRTYASASQIRRISCKSRVAVKGLDPWASDSLILNFGGVEPVTVPEPCKCKFCGGDLDYIAVVNHRCGVYDWEVVEWSDSPVPCVCNEARERQEIAESVRRKRLENEQARTTEETKKSQLQFALIQSGMKKRFMSRTFSTFKRNTAGREAVYRAAKLYADTFDENADRGLGIYIAGSCGTGKTHIAAAISIQLMAQGHSVVFQTWEDMLRDIKSTFSGNGQTEADILFKLKTCDLLVIDDLGKEQATDWSTSQLYGIINSRYEGQRPVIVTTNLGEKELIAAESPRGVGNQRIVAILSRLHEMCMAMPMVWRDCRGKNG